MNRTPTVTEFLNTLDEMRKAYPFEDDKTFIREHVRLTQNEGVGIEIRTVDEVSGCEVTVVRDYLYDDKHWEF